VIRGGTGWVDRVSGAQGLPAGNITGLAAGGSAAWPVLWVGTATGAARYAPGDRPNDRWRFFGGDRWVPGLGTAVTSLAIDPGAGVGAGAWVATEGAGVAHIAARQTTLEAKAAVARGESVTKWQSYVV
jgi:hypothetical protein